METESGFVENWQSGNSVIECNRHMLTSKHSSDVTFRVGKDGETVQAHRYVLISRSCVFDAMLCGPLAEKDDIMISDVEANVFSEMLMYLYTDVATLTPENVTGLLYLAKKYAVGGLESMCLTFLEKSLTPENACLILEHAHRFDEKDLYDKAYKLVLQHGNICFASESFKYLSRDCFDDVMRSGDLIVLSKNAFEAAVTWAETECGRQGRKLTSQNLRSILGETIHGIPFTSMDKEFYVNNVLPRGILTDAENVKIMSCLLCAEQDPSPFIRRSHSSPNDVILYGGHKTCHMQTTQDCVFGRVDFSFSHDVTLNSICLYGGGINFSECKIGSGGPIGKSKEFTFRSSEEMLGGFGINRYHLDASVPLKANKEYYIYVEMEKVSLFWVGNGERESVTAGQCTLSRKCNETYVDGHAHLIYALGITSQQ